MSLGAEVYDAIVAEKNYAGEAETVARVIASTARRSVRSLLDVACGTGRHLEHFRKRFDNVVGLDLEPTWLAAAARRLPGIELVQGDMLDFDLGRQFDAVTCLFAAVAYVRTPENLARAVARMAGHVAPGGVLVVEPFVPPDRFKWGHVGTGVADTPTLKVARFATTGDPGPVARMTFHYLVGRDGTVSYFTEEHALALFTKAQLLYAFRSAGLSASFDDEGLTGRGMVVGVNPSGDAPTG